MTNPPGLYFTDTSLDPILKKGLDVLLEMALLWTQA